MHRTVTCPSCHLALKVKEEALGQRVRCKNCKTQFLLRAPAQPPRAAARPARPSAGRNFDVPTGETVLGSPMPLPRTAPGGRRGPGQGLPLPPGALQAETVMGAPAGPQAFNGSVPGTRPPGRRKLYVLSCMGLLILALASTGAGLAFWFFHIRGHGNGADEVYGKYAGIEISSSAIKTVVVNFSPNDDSYALDIIDHHEDHPETTLVSKEGIEFANGEIRFNRAVVDKTAAYVKSAFDEIRTKHEVPVDRIYVVTSSGVLAEIGKKAKEINKGKPAHEIEAAADAAKDKNEAMLKDAVLGALRGSDKRQAQPSMTCVDETGEGRCIYLACILPKWRANALLLDIGSGNTKGGYMTEKGVFKGVKDFHQGTKTYAKQIAEAQKKKGKFDPEQRERFRKEQLNSLFASQMGKTPGLDQQSRVYLIGGSAWVMMIYMHPDVICKNNILSRLDLSAKDIRTFHGRVMRESREEMHQRAVAEAGADQADHLNDELKKMEGIFKPEQVMAGADILLTLSEELDFEGKKLHFITDSQFSLVLGHIIDQSGVDK